MAWRSGRTKAIEEAAAARVARLAAQWRPGAAATPSSSTDEPDAEPDPWAAAIRPDDLPVADRGWTGRSLRALLMLVAGCLLAAAWWWWSGRPGPIIAAPVSAAPSLVSGVAAAGAQTHPPVSPPKAETSRPSQPAVVIVDVAGLVASPGLVTLPLGARVADAVAAAGGVTKPRASQTVNLARVLVDGEQILVGISSPMAPAGSSATPSPLDLNGADQKAFENLPGVGPVLAERIIAWRLANGPFRSVDELGEVSGIGEATLERLRPLVHV